jgi:hypothetical protein
LGRVAALVIRRCGRRDDLSRRRVRVGVRHISTAETDTAERQGKHGSTTARCGYRPACSIRHDAQFSFSALNVQSRNAAVAHSE